ncbi:MAG: hypothetical protein GF398_00310 [Chitinivibrionales bacterium]|nr:hypothetical protein [Chitinivibrionales bacterium]
MANMRLQIGGTLVIACFCLLHANTSLNILYPNEYQTFYKYDTVMIKYESKSGNPQHYECKVMDYPVMGHQYNNYLRIGMIDPIERKCRKEGSIRPDNPYYGNYPWVIDDWCDNVDDPGKTWMGPTNWLNVDLDSALIRMKQYEGSDDPAFSPSYFAVRWTPRPGGPQKFCLGCQSTDTKQKKAAAMHSAARSTFSTLHISITSSLTPGHSNGLYITDSRGAIYSPGGRKLRIGKIITK